MEIRTIGIVQPGKKKAWGVLNIPIPEGSIQER